MINLSEGFGGDGFPELKIGEVVAHLLYDYRGLIVASDESCQASQSWYEITKRNPNADNLGTTFWSMGHIK